MADPSRAWLDAQYDNRARVPNFQAHLDAWGQTSAALRAERDAALDIGYGATERQAIDLFRPAGEMPPLMVFLHGGYWQALDRKDFSFIARPFVERGVAVAVVGYDLAPTVTVGAIVDQVRRALVFLHRQGAALGVDAARIVVTGHSAGGHLAAMALATEWPDLGAPRTLIRGVVALSGLFDLEPIRRCYLNDVLGLDPADVRYLSPIRLPPPAEPLPVLVSVGGAESEAFLSQSESYTNHLGNHLRTVEHRVEPGLDHFEIVGRFGQRGHPLVERCLAMLGR